MKLFQTKEWASFCEEWFGSKPLFINDALGYDTVFGGFGGKLFRTYNFLDATALENLEEIDNNMPKGLYACKIMSYHDFPPSNNFEKKIEYTFQIDLTQPIENIWQNMSKSTRKNISGWENEVTVRFIEEDELHKYYNLLIETRNRLGLKMPPFYPNKTSWKHFGRKGMLKIAIVETKDKQVLGGLGFLCYEGEILEVGVAQSQKAIDEHIPTGELIKWLIIRWGKANGFKVYDLAGADPAEKSIYFFKEKFGGSLIPKYSYIKIYSPLLLAIKRVKNAI